MTTAALTAETRSGPGGVVPRKTPHATGSERRLVYVWQLPVRVTHWLIFFSIGFLTFTGIYIGHPFFVVSGRAGQHFAMGTIRAIHFYAAIVFTLSVLSRIVYMFVGNRWASWRAFLPFDRKHRRGFGGTLEFYLFGRARPPFVIGHNPVAGLTYSVVFVLFLVMIASGFGLYAINAHVGSPMRGFAFLLSIFGGPQSARWIHHVVMWLLLGFVAHHVASSVLMARVERTGTVDSIFSGYKFVPREELEQERS